MQDYWDSQNFKGGASDKQYLDNLAEQRNKLSREKE